MEINLLGLIEFVIVGILIWATVGYPVWNVWASKKAGEAELQQAYKEQQIQMAQAEARLQAAQVNKQAAIVEAEAVSCQIQTIGTQLKNHDLFLNWQWINMMKEREGETIYVPTEANMPVIEVSRKITNYLREEEGT